MPNPNTICGRLIHCLAEKAANETVGHLCIGLGYTAVQTASGGTGLSYTWFDRKTSCTMVPGGIDYEGRPASDLLTRLQSDHPIERSAAMALVNALNYDHAGRLSEDPHGDVLTELLKIGPGRRVAMVGAFTPLIRQFEPAGVELAVVDDSRGIGLNIDLADRLSNWAQSCIVTATALLNNTMDKILATIPVEIPTVVLGPSTPMIAEAFKGTAVRMLAGTVPVDHEAVLRSVRQGAGTRVLHRFSRKVYEYLETTAA